MSQLVMLACGDARLTSPRACLAPDWLASHMPSKPSAPSAALAFGTSTCGSSLRALAMRHEYDCAEAVSRFDISDE
jgi:hypothetical protein